METEREDTGPGLGLRALRQAAAWLTKDADKGQAISRGLSWGFACLNILWVLESAFFPPHTSSPFLLLPPVETAELNAENQYLLIPYSPFSTFLFLFISIPILSVFPFFPSISCFCSLINIWSLASPYLLVLFILIFFLVTSLSLSLPSSFSLSLRFSFMKR